MRKKQKEAVKVAKTFIDQWKKNSLLSTMIAAMIILFPKKPG